MTAFPFDLGGFQAFLPARAGMESRFDEVTGKLVSSYREIGGLNKLDGQNLPSKLAIAVICEELLALLFPGYFEGQAVADAQLEMITGERVMAMSAKLHNQTAKSLRFQGLCEDDCCRRAGQLVFRLLEALPGVRRLLRTDVEAAYEGDPAARSFEEVILAYPSIEAVSVQRVAHVLYKEGLPVLPRMMTEWAHSRTGIDIHPGAEIGSHFFIDHGTGVVIGETARIGNHVKLYDGVTLGARSFPKDADGRIVKGIKRHPDVEDNVTIYANATILGGETVIGANTTIGASAFLVRSVPPNSLVALEELEHRILDKSKRALKPLEEPMGTARTKAAAPRSGPDRALTLQAQDWARRLGLPQLASRVHVVWSVRLTSTAGNAQHESGRISLNSKLSEVAESQVEQTLLHELAHLIAYERAGRRRIK
ncbi:MAG TPA: serine O-acetyltransferase EpsC, partial [Verrucomicrobiales bacterium]|nr:serine O-acetyltransferase EpsC [Verrucomicrobiales bacterium]